MEIESNCAFSEEFLAAFPSNRTYHNAFRASTPQKGLLWSLDDEKEIIIEEIRENNQTVKKVAEHLGVKASRIYSILTEQKTGGSFYEEANRTRKLDQIVVDQLLQKIEQRKVTQNPFKINSELKPYVLQLAVETDKRQGKSGLNVHVSIKTFNRILECNGIDFEHGQAITL
jgi:transposase